MSLIFDSCAYLLFTWIFKDVNKKNTKCLKVKMSIAGTRYLQTATEKTHIFFSLYEVKSDQTSSFNLVGITKIDFYLLDTRKLKIFSLHFWGDFFVTFLEFKGFHTFHTGWPPHVSVNLCKVWGRKHKSFDSHAA